MAGQQGNLVLLRAMRYAGPRTGFSLRGPGRSGVCGAIGAKRIVWIENSCIAGPSNQNKLRLSHVCHLHLFFGHCIFYLFIRYLPFAFSLLSIKVAWVGSLSLELVLENIETQAGRRIFETLTDSDERDFSRTLSRLGHPSLVF